jgi:hypothetical protein
MLKHYLYLGFGLLLIGGVGAAEWRGWAPTRVAKIGNVPRTVRDNPGSYRPHYTYIGSGIRRGK